MSGRAVRSRLLDLRQSREAARRGREVLEQKLELLRRELQRRTALRDERRVALRRSLQAARDLLREARIELGRRALESAALAQPEAPEVAWQRGTVVGVEVPRLHAPVARFRPRYGPGGTAPSLDKAGEAFTDLLQPLIVLATEEAAVRSLRRGLRQTARRLNALEKAILPALDREMRELTAALEEEEREESTRRKVWLEAQALPGGRG